MATLLHHIQPLMQRSIAEAEERLERRMVQPTEQKIAEVHQHFDTFELQVLARLAPQEDVSTPQAAVESLRADIDMILEARVTESEAPSAEPAEAQCWRINHLPLERMPIGVGVERRKRLGNGRRSTLRWRMRGKPRLLMRRSVRSGL